ncbi:DUF4266 domain-containing protein [Hymenobacter terrenus]|uniref:DUF4266 domain-containing protein n=1 Tax=Hymenobacter terrenus TaxID=1629124 RepID=UPI0009080903|nr:DUF4266 domain-containing protein [Hymenobacter terrenus]
MNRLPYQLLLLVGIIGFSQGCATVKPYQRAYLNDERMQVGRRHIDKLNDNTHTYREGSTGGGGGNASGGCGCN